MSDEQEIRFEFDSQPLMDDEVQAVQTIRKAFSQLMDKIDPECPKGRYYSLVCTKLEEAQMFAVKSITHNLPK